MKWIPFPLIIVLLTGCVGSLPTKLPPPTIVVSNKPKTKIVYVDREVPCVHITEKKCKRIPIKLLLPVHIPPPPSIEEYSKLSDKDKQIKLTEYSTKLIKSLRKANKQLKEIKRRENR